MRAALFAACLLAAAPAMPQDAVTPDGGRYTGALRDGKLHGSGRLEWSNGNVYDGEFRDGLMSGRGTLRNLRGDVYQGEFRRGYYWGRGELVYADGRRYRGEFAHGYFQGRGRYETPHGEVYEGDFSENEFTGRGTLARADGGRYRGGFASWRFHGDGRYTDPAGNVYEGTFANGEMTGRGTLSYPEGRYEGDFKQWRFHGQGELRLVNGDVYRGAFENGRYHGEGTLTYAKPRPDGATGLSGNWRYGSLDSPALRRQVGLNVEAALYNQPVLLEKALAALQPRDPSRVNLYLLAVAGDGTQEVFRREAEFVSRQFAERFGAGGRTVALINSRNTVDSAPMATTRSITAALQAIAARMDREQDILFVFLTSHASKAHELLLEQAGMDLPALTAAELGRLIKESGIRYKVIVVSACYGGGFIEFLKDEGTLVIAAARHDRTSFGCTDENEFTYFGRAFFLEALPQAGSFQDAFRRSEKLVREMELREGIVDEKSHSLPQMSSAVPIERQLSRWWTQKR